MQQGGNALPPLVSYQPVINAGVSQSKAVQESPSESTSSDLTDKDLLSMLNKLDGLPSDMSVLTQTLQNFYIDQQYSPFPNTSNIESRYLSALYQMKQANFNKKEYDDAFDIVSKNGGINEFAITDTGQLLCENINKQGDYTLLSVNQLRNSNEYRPITNAELLRKRAYDQDLANNSAILRVIKNGIGIDAVTKMIKDSIQTLGSTEQSDEGFFSTPSKKLIGGLKDFINASKNAQISDKYQITTDNLYHYEYMTKDQAEQANQAFNYIYNTLPENAKTLLMLKAPEHTIEGAQKLIQSLIATKANKAVKFKIDNENEKPGKGSSSGSKSGKSSGFDLDPVSMLQAGYGEKQKITIQTATGGNAGIQLDTVRMPITKKDGNSIGSNSTLADITESAFSGYLDFENASMGGVNIPTVGFNNIAVNGAALYTGYLPIDLVEYNNTGNIRPDINMLERYQKVQKEIAANDITDKNEINQLYRKAHLPLLYDGNGNVMMNYKKFGMVNATALGTAFDEDVSFADYLFETRDENTIKNTLTILQQGRGEKDRIDFDEKSFFDSIFGTDYDHVYKGTVFIPVNEDHFTASGGSGNYPTSDEAELIEAKQQVKDRENIVKNSYVNPGRL